MAIAAVDRPDQDDPAVRNAQETRLRAVWAPPKGLFLRWTDTNNDAIGAWYTLTAFAMMLFAGVLALVMRAQLAVPDNDLVSASTFNQLFTLHGSMMMFLFAVPMFEAVSILHPAQPAGRARPAVSPALGVRLLELPDRRRVRRRLDLLRRGARRRLVHVPAARDRAVAVGHRRRHLDARPVVHRSVVDRGRGRVDRRRAEVPAARACGST